MKRFLALFLFGSISLAAMDLSDPGQVIHQLVEGNYQKDSEVQILQIFELDEAFFQAVAKDVLNLVQDQTSSVPAEPGHLTNWIKPEGLIKQYSLLNESGRCDDFSIDHNRSVRGKKFAHGTLYPHLDQFIHAFPHAVNFRISVLFGNSSFAQHQEDICFINRITNKPALRVRFHLPIVTNEQAFMLMQGSLYRFNPGKIYFFHNGCIHSALNLHPTEVRIHLLWDMLLTEDTFTRMFERSKNLPFFTKLETTTLTPVQIIGIDPNYKRTERAISYQTALQATLCPVQ